MSSKVNEEKEAAETNKLQSTQHYVSPGSTKIEESRTNLPADAGIFTSPIDLTTDSARPKHGTLASPIDLTIAPPKPKQGTTAYKYVTSVADTVEDSDEPPRKKFKPSHRQVYDIDSTPGLDGNEQDRKFAPIDEGDSCRSPEAEETNIFSNRYDNRRPRSTRQSLIPPDVKVQDAVHMFLNPPALPRAKDILSNADFCEIFDISDTEEDPQPQLQPQIAQPLLKVVQDAFAQNVSAVQKCQLERLDCLLEPGKAVELRDGSFLTIESIWYNDLVGFTFRGYILERDFKGAPRFIDARDNELVWITKVTITEHAARLDSQLEERSEADILRPRKVTFTNLLWDRVNLGAQKGSEKSEPEMLFCRWKYIKVVSGIRNGMEVYEEECVRLLAFDEIRGMDLQLDAASMREVWNPGNVLPSGGSLEVEQYDVDESIDTSTRVYTTGDAFCGAGGASCGAIDAGLHVDWGFDHHPPAIETYDANFSHRGTRALNHNDVEFISLIDTNAESFRVDHIHFSPPCQAFSAANTTGTPEGKWKNTRPVLSLGYILGTLKPRVATIEETVGLLNRHPDWFYTLIASITSIGYSVRWKKVDAATFGVPQRRHRLLINISAYVAQAEWFRSHC